MKSTLFLTVFLKIYFFSFFNTVAQGNDLAQASSLIQQSHLSLSFEENKGQVHGADCDKVRFTIKGNGLNIFILENGIAYQYKKVHYPDEYQKAIQNRNEDWEQVKTLSESVRTETFRMDAILVDANTNAEIIAEEKSADYIQYYNHNALNVHSYKKLTYKNIYPKIDWILYFKEDKLVYDFIVHPGGNPNDIQIRYDHAGDVVLQTDGCIIMQSLMGDITDHAPVSFQGDQRITTSYELQDNLVTFKIANYDVSQILIIDPEVEWATYYGGDDEEFGYSCATDSEGNVYLAGNTKSTSEIASGGHQNVYGSVSDAFLVKFNSSGVRQWATYYGGSEYEYGNSCATDSDGSVYLAGLTSSPANIASGGHQNTIGGGDDAFLVKFNSSGVRQWATYYGGSGDELGYSCITDSEGNAYLSGRTTSVTDIASGGHQDTIGSVIDAFLVKFSNSGVRQWATYYGGSETDYGYSCATDSDGYVYLAGLTKSVDEIASGGHQNSLAGNWDAFLVKFSSSGVRQWATYYGGSEIERINQNACTTDGLGNVYLAGETSSPADIASEGHQNTIGGLFDAFLVKFNSSGVRQWATYYGGSNEDYGRSCATDSEGYVYLSGAATSTDGISSGGYQNELGGIWDAFLVKFDSNGTRIWGTYHGGSQHDYGVSCAIAPNDDVFIGSSTNSIESIASEGHQNSIGGTWDAFLVKIVPCTVLQNNLTETICEGLSYLGYSVTGVYYDTFTTSLGCDSLRILNLTVTPTPVTNITEEICEGFSYLGYSATGIYYDTFTAGSGCDSIRILDLSVLPPPVTNITEEICEGESYLGYSATGVYVDTFTTVMGCDSIRIIYLTIHPQVLFTDSQTICEGVIYSGYSVSGTYVDTFSTANGCDSIRTLHLAVTPVVHTTTYDTICSGESSEGYSVPGSYTDTFTGINGCDSIRTLVLFVAPVYDLIEDIVLCSNELPHTFLGITIPSGTSSSPSYATLNLSSLYGCDSNVTINLTVLDTGHTAIDTLVCFGEHFLWNDISISEEGIYFFTTTNVAGCDSVTTLQVLYTPTPLSVDTTLEQCGQVVYESTVFTQSTQFVDTFSNYFGCDSLYRKVDIVVLDIVYDTLAIDICEGEGYQFDDTLYQATTIVTHAFLGINGCDSFSTLVLTVNALPEIQLDYRSLEDKILCIGDTIVLIADGAVTYTYLDQYSDTLNGQYPPYVNITGTNDIFYVVGTDAAGCSNIAELSPHGQHCCDILIPNAFSPNGDGLNDEFGVVTSGHPQNFIIQIFDRWGKMIFVSYKTGDQWDGNYNGKPLDVGVYYYHITATCSDGSIFTRSGEVTLLR